MDLKIIGSISIALLASFASLMFFLHWFPDSTQYREREFFAQKLDPKINNIFLIGSSHVGMLNTTLINERVNEDHTDYHVYNLAYIGDHPEERIKTLNKIISLKPQIILYGISYRDLESTGSNQILPNVPEFIDYIQTRNLAFQFDMPNPKLTTLSMIQDYTKSHRLFSRESGVIYNDTPFFKYYASYRQISTLDELKKMSPSANIESNHLESPSRNKEVKALQEMIEVSHKNHIKIVIFTTPQQKFYLDTLNPSEKATFDSTLEYLNTNSNVKIYNLTDKYENLPIWLNLNHVAYNPTSSIYSDDVANIILRELAK